jgi:(S)-ureidoglycine-glyoxylate aminotransferase
MPIADPRLPVRLLAGGGPGAPDPRVLRALTTPLIGQFDPDFTAVMDDVVHLARATWLTVSPHCFAVSALGSGGLEALLNSLVEAGQRVAVGGCAACVAATAERVRRLGATPIALDVNDTPAELSVVPFIDPHTCALLPVAELASACHAHAGRLVVDATLGLAARELRVDDWGIDACVAGVDYALGAPAGLALVTYSPDLHAQMEQRASPPTTSYLDLLQL